MVDRKKTILIIGSNGMLGQRLIELYSKSNNVNLVSASLEKKSFFESVKYFTLNIADRNELSNLINSVKPSTIINTAAYTAVDKAEVEKETAELINSIAVNHIAEICKQLKIHFINISTDYVFDGLEGPYKETDITNPIGFYGKTKLKGEENIINSGVDFTIIRTNVLYGPAKYGRPDFVKWVVTSLKEKKQIKIVTDQINNPTYTDDLAKGIFLCEDMRQTGIYNIGGSEFLSRYNFTLRIAEYFNLEKDLVKPILTEELKQMAKRPLKSGLVIDKAIKELNYSPLNIEETFSWMEKEIEF